MVRIAALLAGAMVAAACSGPPPAPPPGTAAAAQVAQQALGDALPLSPTQLAELQGVLREVHSLTRQMQGASQQGRARLVRRQLDRFLDGLDRPVPFRSNLERIADVLSKSSGDELSESEKGAVRNEVQAILKELGVDTSGSQSSDDFPAFAPPPPGPGPGGPGPGGPPPLGPGPPGPPPPGPGPPR